MLTIIRGLPGSGKSTLAKLLLNSGEVDSHYEADMYHVKDGVYVFNRENLKKAHEWCLKATRRSLADNECVVVSNTFVKMWELKAYEDLAKEFKVPLNVIECRGSFRSIHGVPQDVLDQMASNYELYVDA